jgi:hypothetical protein
MLSCPTAAAKARKRQRRAAWGVVVAALGVLAGCGASSFATFAGLDIAQRGQLSTWTPVLERKHPAPGSVVASAASSPGGAVFATASTTVAPGALAPVAASSADRVGRFTLLTYNVAGLPQMFSPSTPRTNIPLVSPLLNLYDVALVQEDFSYHRELARHTDHAFRSTPMDPRSFVGDGLSQFSRLAFGAIHRVRWERCNGYVSSSTDCLADKGFSFSELHLAPGTALHLYNLHADAGAGRRDIRARAMNFRQLADYIRRRSQAHAVIVAGDTNLRTLQPGDAEILDGFLEGVGLRDVHRSLVRVGEEPIDRVMIRSSAELALESLGWWEDHHFFDARGNPLSDHPAVGVVIGWQRVDRKSLIAELGAGRREHLAP